MIDAFSRKTDPVTSREAANSVACLPELEAAVLNVLVLAGARGLNLDEIIDATGLDKVTASPRLRPLANKGLVTEAAKPRKGKSGRNQTVWLAI